MSSQVLWGDGTLLTRVHGVEDRDPVKLADMATVLPKAVIAIEDARYFEHGGFDVRGIARALTHNIEKGRAAEGGSTITQQYVRAVMLGSHKTLKRKLREAVMAMQFEDRYSKQTILERYLNTVYFGNGAYGVQAAARTYFGKDAAALDLAQSALLAGVIRSPNDYDPFTRPEVATARRNEVIDRMRSLGRITQAEADVAACSADRGDAPTLRYALPRAVLRREGEAVHLQRPAVRRDDGRPRAQALPGRADHRDHARSPMATRSRDRLARGAHRSHGSAGRDRRGRSAHRLRQGLRRQSGLLGYLALRQVRPRQRAGRAGSTDP